MNKKSINILQEFQQSVIVCEWECYLDIEQAFENAFGEAFDTTNQYVRSKKDEAYEIGNELNKLYPDFNFFEI